MCTIIREMPHECYKQMNIYVPALGPRGILADEQVAAESNCKL